MRAVVVKNYGPPEVARVTEVPTPIPGRGEALIKVSAAAVSAGDARIRGARFPRGFAPFARLAFGVRRLRQPILGGTYSGVVEALGPDVTGLSVGDEVCGMTGAKMGTHAELVVVKSAKAVAKPSAVSHDDAAGLLFGGTTAQHFLTRLATVRPGSRVLVIGATGAVGSNVTQLAAAAGAQVTAVCSASNAALARQLGAREVMDYAASDVTDPGAVGAGFDIVTDCVGVLTRRTGLPLLAPDGRLLLIAADLWQSISAPLGRGRVVAGVAKEDPEMMRDLLALVAAGSLRVVRDEPLPLDEIATAYALVDSGHKVGNVVVHPQVAS